MKFVSCIFWGFVFLTNHTFGQADFFKNTSVTANYHYGFAVPEYSFITYLVDRPLHGLTLDFTKQTTGKNEWERLYKYPEYGFSFYHSTLGNKKAFGTAYAMNYFFKVNFISLPKFKVYNQTGIGLGYLTKKFDLDNNYENVGIGSHINVHFNFRLGAQYQLARKGSINLGLTFDHFSNGNTGDPNLGLNNLCLLTGFRYQVGESTPKKSESLAPYMPQNYFTFFASAGGKQTRALASNFFFTSSLSGGIHRAFFRGVHLGIGADVFYDESMQTQIEAKGEPYRRVDDFQTGIHVSQAFVYNRFSLILQEGFYVGLTNKGIRKAMYNRGIVQFQLNDRVLLRMAMKSHLHILDFPEIGLGIKW